MQFTTLALSALALAGPALSAAIAPRRLGRPIGNKNVACEMDFNKGYRGYNTYWITVGPYSEGLEDDICGELYDNCGGNDNKRWKCRRDGDGVTVNAENYTLLSTSEDVERCVKKMFTTPAGFYCASV